MVVATVPSSGAKKLGHPVPLSNFRSALKSGSPQPTQWKVPGRCSASSAQDPGGSVECRRSTAYCWGVNMRRHSSSVFSTGKCSGIRTGSLFPTSFRASRDAAIGGRRSDPRGVILRPRSVSGIRRRPNSSVAARAATFACKLDAGKQSRHNTASPLLPALHGSNVDPQLRQRHQCFRWTSSHSPR